VVCVADLSIVLVIRKKEIAIDSAGTGKSYTYSTFWRLGMM
jgi:hypothetical protein